MKHLSVGLAGALILVSIAVYAASCPVDYSTATWTGESKTDSVSSKLLYKMKCVRGHTYWSTSNS